MVNNSERETEAPSLTIWLDKSVPYAGSLVLAIACVALLVILTLYPVTVERSLKVNWSISSSCT